MDIEKAFEEFIEKEWHDGHEPQGIDDQYVEEMEDEEVEEARAYKNKQDDDEKKKKRPFAFGGKKKSRHGSSGYGKGEEVDAHAKVMAKKGDSAKAIKKMHPEITDDELKDLLGEVKEDYDKNQLLRVQHDEKLISEAGDICGLDKADLRSKSMQAVWDKKCSPETSKKKKKSIFGKSAKGLKLYNQNLKGEEKMEKLVDTVRRVLVGEDSDKDDPGTQGDMAAYQKKRKAVAKKFGVESCSALKDEKEKKACYKALDDAHVADHEEQVELEKMNKEEVVVKKKVTEGVDLKKLKKEYEDNEDSNNHTGNYLLLAKSFGSKSDVKKVEDIMKRNEKQGSTSRKDMDWMHKNIGPYYDKIRNEEVKVEKTISKLFSHVRKLMSK